MSPKASPHQSENKAVLIARDNGVTEKGVNLREPSWVLAKWLWKSVPWPAEALGGQPSLEG